MLVVVELFQEAGSDPRLLLEILPGGELINSKELPATDDRRYVLYTSSTQFPVCQPRVARP
jgi:hypothetical protein